jgi:predicted MarR family transcription regulator
MPPEGVNGSMDVIRKSLQHGGEQVASVTELASGGYQVMVSESEFALMRTALAEAERVSRFGIEVLDEADRSRAAGPPASSRLLQEIDVLAMREASLRSLQKTMAEVERGARLAGRCR